MSANLAEAWRKRRYEKSFISKLTDAEGEAAETQVWVAYSYKCGYMLREEALALHQPYDGIIRTIVGMVSHSDSWILPGKREP